MNITWPTCHFVFFIMKQYNNMKNSEYIIGVHLYISKDILVWNRRKCAECTRNKKQMLWWTQQLCKGNRLKIIKEVLGLCLNREKRTNKRWSSPSWFDLWEKKESCRAYDALHHCPLLVKQRKKGKEQFSALYLRFQCKGSVPSTESITSCTYMEYVNKLKQL